MSDSRRVEGDRVYCHSCDNEWDRARGGLQCPACSSEFVEIVNPTSQSTHNTPPPIPLDSRPMPSLRSPNPFYDHNPWAPDPEEPDITTFEFNSAGGRGMFSFTSRTYTMGGRNNPAGPRDIAVDELGRNVEAMLGSILGQGPRRPTMMGGQFFDHPPYRNDRGFAPTRPGQAPDLLSMLFQGGGQRGPSQAVNPFDIIGAMFNPGNARQGDMVFSQEAFDRIMTQLMEQNTSNAPGPASEAAIAALRKKKVDESMMGSDGQAECSICMDNVELGSEVTMLPCNHWFHGDCVTSWLKEHDTCPHCRQPTANAGSAADDSSPTSPASGRRRRRISRRSSSAISPVSPAIDGTYRGETSFPVSPGGLRDARHRYHGSPRASDSRLDRPPRERRSSERSHTSNDNSGDGANNSGSGSNNGGVTGWIRSRLPFS